MSGRHWDSVRPLLQFYRFEAVDGSGENILSQFK